jgi:N-dimethylarginine dimethylaminohydrolase
MTPDQTLTITSEFGALQTVVLASPRHFRVIDPVNATQRRFFDRDPPEPRRLVEEQRRFAEILEENSVEVLWAAEMPDRPLQLNTRDIAAVAGSHCLVANMRFPIRAPEIDAALPLIERFSGQVSKVDAAGFEGGDVIVDGDDVYVGLGQRTDPASVEQIEALLHGSGLVVHPVPLADDVLHLDVVLNLTSSGFALVHSASFTAGVPEGIASRYELIEATEEEYDQLGINVFTVRPGLVVVDSRNPGIEESLRSRGLNTIGVDFTDTTKIGGSFRCMTLPLRRAEPS